ncbi:MAG: response regulator [Pyrinomonadaceae bacterium]
MRAKIEDAPLILIVDDYEDIRITLKLFLEQHGFRVLDTDTGTKALEIILRERPALVVLDMFMPKVDGFATARLIREHAALRQLPIIAISAHDTLDLQSAALAAGCNEFINKPHDLEHLAQVINQLLDKK